MEKIIDEFLGQTHSMEDYIRFCEQYVPVFINTLLAHAIKKDFFIAPASTKYHGACRGGLVKHSLAVVSELAKLMDTWILRGDSSYVQEAIIAALFHDICKAQLYIEKDLWRKDEYGKWESYKGYTINSDVIQIGHGVESLRIIERFYQFKNECWAQAVAWHMGMPEGYIEKQQYINVITKYPEVLAMHTADMYASMIRGF